eukprot:8613590-Pyramimonas_sp.AAC.1
MSPVRACSDYGALSRDASFSQRNVTRSFTSTGRQQVTWRRRCSPDRVGHSSQNSDVSLRRLALPLAPLRVLRHLAVRRLMTSDPP